MSPFSMVIPIVMNPHSVIANDFRLSLEAGLIDRTEIIEWADEIIGSEPFDESIANISLAFFETDKQLVSLLGAVAREEELWSGTRQMRSRMYQALLNEPDRLRDFTGFLEELARRNDYKLPDDLKFLFGVDEDYQCAVDGLWGSVEEVRVDLIENLAKFKTVI